GQARQLGLILTDQKMPKTTGTELLTQVKAMAPKACRALLTGHAGLDSAVTAINKQLVDRYFTKPITDHVDFANGIVHLLNEYLLGERQDWYIARLRAQYEFARNLSTQNELRDVLDLTVSFIAENLHCDRVSIMLIEDAYLVVKAHRGLPEHLDVENIRIPVGQGVAGNVFQSGLPNYRNDRNPNYWQEDDSPVECSFRVFASLPLMLAPLRLHDMPLGVINVTERLDDKPFTRDEAALLAYIADTVSIAINNQLSRRDLENLYYQTITSLALAMESKDPYTAGHSQRVHEYAVGIARQLGLSAKDVEQIGRAALLHDLGKIGVPEHIVDKPGPLTEQEFEPMARHPAEGARIIEALSFLKQLAPVIRTHHERLDGQGYPDHIKADQIPLAARIIAVADTVDAMTSDRPYRKALPAEQMLAELEKVSSSQLDAQCVQAFIAFWQDRQEQENAKTEALAQASTD
ncbi:MAG: HD domain-containing protein, partial [Phycisphaerae bacterium]|nr:HD domain-containing protein [Phycisphaerae bacterium]